MNGFVQLDPALQELIVFGITALVSFLILQVAAKLPWLAEYLGQYKVGIVAWLSSLVFQLLQAGLNKVPVTWEGVAVLVMQLLVTVAGVLLAFAGWRKAGLKGKSALM
jgi:hypothetical protein